MFYRRTPFSCINMRISAKHITIYPIFSDTKGIYVICKHHSLFWINQPEDKHRLDHQRPSLDVLTSTTSHSKKCHQTTSSHHIDLSYQWNSCYDSNGRIWFLLTQQRKHVLTLPLKSLPEYLLQNCTFPRLASSLLCCRHLRKSNPHGMEKSWDCTKKKKLREKTKQSD